ncbi:MAG: YceI family protein [Pseudobdellovibrionaceae bacterium]
MKIITTPLRTLAVAGLLLAATGTGAAYAESQKYTLEMPHTQVLFAVDHMGFTKSYGQFLKFDGGFTFDESDPEAATIDVTIDTNSLEMDDEKWNEHLKNADFFNVEKFPSMHFVSTKIEKTGERTGIVTGDLTLLGVTKPVTLNVTFNKKGPHPMKELTVAGFSAKGELKRSDFGMGYGIPMVGDTVDIILEVHGETPAPKNE